jgi:hypothetical protein
LLLAAIEKIQKEREDARASQEAAMDILEKEPKEGSSEASGGESREERQKKREENRGDGFPDDPAMDVDLKDELTSESVPQSTSSDVPAATTKTELSVSFTCLV